MRKMDYCRYDSPTYTGIFNTDRSSFILDRPAEPGIYMVIMTDPVDKDVFTFHLTVKGDLDSYADYMSVISGNLAHITL